MPKPLKSNQTKQYDLAIIGGGLVGASLAVSLAETDYNIAVIEPFAADAKQQPSYDERTIALTLSSKNIFKQIKVWDDALAADACAIKHIHISNKGHFGISNLSHQDANAEALGFVLPTRTIGQALSRQLAAANNIDLYCPYEAKAISVEESAAFAELTIKQGHDQGNQRKTLQASLAIIADGGRSPLLDDLGFSKQNKVYAQSALLCIVKSQQPHQHKAYERFVKDGPLALLPMTGQRYAVVWTLSQSELSRISALSNAKFLAELQSTFGTRAGLLSQPSPRKAYPLSKSVLETPYKPRILALGNAAHTVHPVAGQGFNLGLRDVAALAELLDQNLVSSKNTKMSPEISSEVNTDIGSTAFLQAYFENRRLDTNRVGQFTDGLLSIFRHQSPIVQLGRNIGLSVVENLPFVKRALLKRTMGLSQHQPRLARGLKLHR